MTPYDKLRVAEVEYLEASGWVLDGTRWIEPQGRRRDAQRALVHGHAVNSQKQHDAIQAEYDAWAQKDTKP